MRLPTLILAALATLVSAKLPPEVDRGLERLSSQSPQMFMRDQEVADFLGRGLDTDEAALVDRVLALTAGYPRTRTLRVLGATLAGRSQASLIALLVRLAPAERPAVAEAGYRVLGERAFAEAKASLPGLPDNGTRDSARLALAMVLAKSDARGAEALAQGLDDQLRARVLRHIAFNWSLDDPRGLLRWVDGLALTDVDLRVQLINNLAFRLTSSRPDQAMALLPMFPDEVRPLLCGMMSRRLARSNLPKALVWMSTLTEQADRSEALLGLIEVWAAADPETARAAVADWPDAAVRPRLHGMLASGWAAKDPGAAISWALTLAPELREDALAKSLNQMSLADPAGARRALMDLPPGEERNRLAERLITNRPGSRELAEWALRYPDEATARRMTKRAVFGWATRLEDDSLGEVESWVLAVGDAALRDQALLGAIDGTVHLIQARRDQLDPDVFLRLAEAIADPTLRREQARRVADLWKRAYPDDTRKPFARLLGEDPGR